MWNIFKDENEYNEKAIIGFISFALMCIWNCRLSYGYHRNRTYGQ